MCPCRYPRFKAAAKADKTASEGKVQVAPSYRDPRNIPQRRPDVAYHFSTITDLSFDAAIAATTDAFARHGFGILTQIDVQATLAKKLDADFRPYRILGACNPPMAYQALLAEDRIWTMMPCNAIVQQRDGGKVEVSAVDPFASMAALENPKLAEATTKVSEMLRQVFNDVGARENRSLTLGAVAPTRRISDAHGTLSITPVGGPCS